MLMPAAEAQRWGSASNYVRITKHKVEQLANAVRVVLEADGQLEVNANAMDFWEYDEETDWYSQKQLKRFRIDLLNARSDIGRFVDVGKYPVSHVNLSVPTEAREGVGLNVALVLYVPGTIGKVQMNRSVNDWTQWNATMPVDMVLSDDKRKLILTAHLEHHQDASAAKPRQASQQERLILEPTPAGSQLNALRVPFEALMREIGEQSGLRVLVSSGIDLRVTAVLPAMPAEDLVAALCRAYCLRLSLRDGVYYITSGLAADSASYWSANVRTTQLKNMSVDDALRMLPPFILRHVRADPETNTLTAFGSGELLDKIERDVAKLDNPGKQVRLKVMVVQVMEPRTYDRLMDILLQGGTSSVDLRPLEGRVSVGVTDQPLDHIRFRLQMLESDGLLRTDMQPQMLVLSGRQAKMFVGKQQFYRFLKSTWQGNELELRRVDVGLRLDTTPWTGDGRTIMLPFTIGTDSIVSRDADGLPLVARFQASGSLRVASGDSVIFGGLRLRNTYVDDSRIHPLAEAPLIGGLLKTRSVTHENNEVIVCLSAETVATPPFKSKPAAEGATDESAPDPTSVVQEQES